MGRRGRGPRKGMEKDRGRSTITLASEHPDELSRRAIYLNQVPDGSTRKGGGGGGGGGACQRGQEALTRHAAATAVASGRVFPTFSFYLEINSWQCCMRGNSSARSRHSMAFICFHLVCSRSPLFFSHSGRADRARVTVRGSSNCRPHPKPKRFLPVFGDGAAKTMSKEEHKTAW